MCVAGIDPGRDKCGVAILTHAGEIKFQQVIETEKLQETFLELAKKFDLKLAILGNGTTSKSAKEILEKILPVKVIDEKYTTEEARRLYWKKNPPQGWRKFLPVSMQVPPVPVDDIVAEILVKRFLESEKL